MAFDWEYQFLWSQLDRPIRSGWYYDRGQIGLESSYGSEVMRIIQRHGFETLNLNRIYLHVLTENKRAIRTFEKAGYVLEGPMGQAVFSHGKYNDNLSMSVLREEWAAGIEEN